MPPHSVSNHLKARIPVLHYQQGLSVKEICQLLGIKKTLVYQTLQYHHNHGSIRRPLACQGRLGRRHILDAHNISFIHSLLLQKHTVYVDEVQEQLLSQRGTQVSTVTLIHTLRCLRLTNKAVSGGALERNDELRALYMN
ncbi:hypothetical protein FIBSPDRAFT_761736 [Athelia psychrophila]|uniref:Resolvase HTH domain-containing protein n=1 Tax=Athelia psychrophila TaxID=1759441 RepID=A0A165X5J3_9AGAM|nr:hypothetical protein FIBSPDRAFT_761736 [Fibularhizoctonia sp. CBS 109695]